MPDLNTMNQERKLVSDNLQTVLNQFVENAGIIGGNKSLSVLTHYETRLNAIMKLDQTIADEIERHRTWLKKNLTHLKQGKTAIKGYKTAGINPNTPRVFSLSR